MKLTVDDYLKMVTADKVQVMDDDKTATQAQQKKTLTAAVEFVQEQLNKGYLGQYRANVRMRKGDPVSFRLESNLINIPMDEAERLDPKLLDKEPAYPVNLYMVVESDDVNKSGLRIDELANETDQGRPASSLVAKIQPWLAGHLAAVMEARA